MGNWKINKEDTMRSDYIHLLLPSKTFVKDLIKKKSEKMEHSSEILYYERIRS